MDEKMVEFFLDRYIEWSLFGTRKKSNSRANDYYISMDRLYEKLYKLISIQFAWNIWYEWNWYLALSVHPTALPIIERSDFIFILLHSIFHFLLRFLVTSVECIGVIHRIQSSSDLFDRIFMIYQFQLAPSILFSNLFEKFLHLMEIKLFLN